MTDALRGKVALVTAGTQGIGRGIAEALLRAGAEVYLTSRSQERAHEAAAELGSLGPAHGIASELLGDEACCRLADAVGELHPNGVHILVNNPATSMRAPMEETTEGSFDEVMSLNLKTPFLLTRAMLAHLRRGGSSDDPARVVNVGSISGLLIDGLPSYAYSSSKAALHHLTKILALELAPEITVNAVAPGPFDSGGLRRSFEQHEGVGSKLRSPLRRIGRPEEIGGAVVYLTSDVGAYCTGVIMPVEGGIQTTR